MVTAEQAAEIIQKELDPAKRKILKKYFFATLYGMSSENMDLLWNTEDIEHEVVETTINKPIKKRLTEVIKNAYIRISNK